MKTPKPPNPVKLLESDTAVVQYLDDLLQEVSEAPESELQVVPRVTTQTDTVSEAPAVDLDETQATATMADVVPIHAEISLADEVAVALPEALPEAPQQAFEFPLQCLLFEVKGVALALPLVDLESVIPMPDEMSQLPGYAAMVKGVVQNRGQNVSVLDTAALLNMRVAKDDQETHVLVLHDARFGLSCDRLGSVVKLEEDDVQWLPATASDQPRLLLGKIRDRLTALLNPQGLRQQFKKI